MLHRALQITILLTLWIANIMIAISIWRDIFALGVIGLLFGVIFGLPATYLWLSVDKFAMHQFKTHIRPHLMQLARRQPNRQTTEKHHVPVLLNDGEKEIIIMPEAGIKSLPASAPAPVIHVPIEIIDSSTEASVETSQPLPPAPATPPSPTEWELQQIANEAYTQAKAELALVADEDYAGIIDYFSHEDARVRLAVVQRLRHLDHAEVGEVLHKAINDTDAVVQRAARIALEEYQTKSSS